MLLRFFLLPFMFHPSYRLAADGPALIGEYVYTPGNRLRAQVSGVKIATPEEFAEALAIAANGAEAKSEAVAGRAGNVVEILRAASSGLALDSGDPVYSSILNNARRLLTRFAVRGIDNENIVAIFDNLQLWGPSEAWYFAKLAKFDRTLKKNALRIISIVHRLSGEDAAVFESALRSRALTDVRLIMLQKMNRATVGELQQVESALRFCEAVLLTRQ
jgi:hypothetical protein